MKQRIFDRETQTFVNVSFHADHKGAIPSALVTITPDHNDEKFNTIVEGSILVSAAFNAIRAKNLDALIEIVKLFPHQSEAVPQNPYRASSTGAAHP